MTVDGPRMSFKWNSLEPESETPSQEGTVYLPFEAWQSVAIHPPSNVVAVAERTGVDPYVTSGRLRRATLINYATFQVVHAVP